MEKLIVVHLTAKKSLELMMEKSVLPLELMKEVASLVLMVTFSSKSESSITSYIHSRR